MNGASNKLWYKKWWVILLLVLLWPIGISVLIWTRSWKTLTRAAIIAGFWVSLFTMSALNPSKDVSKETKIANEAKKEIETQTPNDEKLPSVTIRAIPSASPSAISKLYTVTKVIDGDTIQVRIDSKNETIRLIGIDTPEIVDPRKPVQCFAAEASNKAKATLTGKNVSLESDPTQGERDKYNRLLRFVFMDNGQSFNKMMISEGYAHEYTYQSNPYKYQLEFIQAEKEARETKHGLWADNACPVAPTTTSQSQAPSSSGSYTCNCSKTCTQITTCEEAYFQLNQCGCSIRDNDSDGMPCENLCQ